MMFTRYSSAGKGWLSKSFIRQDNFCMYVFCMYVLAFHTQEFDTPEKHYDVIDVLAESISCSIQVVIIDT